MLCDWKTRLRSTLYSGDTNVTLLSETALFTYYRCDRLLKNVSDVHAAIGCGRHGMPPPVCKNLTSQAVIAGRGIDSACSIGVPMLNFVGLSVWKIWRTSGLSISRLGDLDLRHLTFKLVHVIARAWDGNLPTKFGVSRTFRSLRIDQHTSDASYDRATLTFGLWPWNCCTLLPMGWATVLPILVFLGRFIFDLIHCNNCSGCKVLFTEWIY